MQIIESWVRRCRQEKAHRNQRPYLLQFEHVLHELLRSDALKAYLAPLHRSGMASPSLDRLLVQVLLESWLSRVTNFEGGLSVVPQLLDKLSLQELMDGTESLLFRRRNDRLFFEEKKSGRLAAVAAIGASAAAQGSHAELEAQPGSGAGLIVGMAAVAKEAIKSGMKRLMRKQENILIDVMFDILLQSLLLRNLGVFIEPFVPGYVQQDEPSLLQQLVEAYFDAIPGVVSSTRLNAKDWSLQRVLEWLDELELSAYGPLFSEHLIDGLALISISSDELRSIGVPLGVAKRIIALVPRFEKTRGSI